MAERIVIFWNAVILNTEKRPRGSRPVSVVINARMMGGNMAKRKNRERAEREGPFRNQERADETRYQCPFPGCGRAFWKEPGQPDLCNEHRRFVSDLVFALNHLKPPDPVSEKKVKGGPKLFVPNPGMSDKAIQEARQAAGMGP